LKGDWRKAVMTNRQLKEIAKAKGLIVRNMKPENIIRRIQRIEGNSDCFGTANAELCSRYNCSWRSMCLYTKEFISKPPSIEKSPHFPLCHPSAGSG
jgi:hypothetical protein